MINIEFVRDVNSASEEGVLDFISAEIYEVIVGGEIVMGSTPLLQSDKQKKLVDDALEHLLQKIHEVLQSGFVTDEGMVQEITAAYEKMHAVSFDPKALDTVVNGVNNSLEIRADDY